MLINPLCSGRAGVQRDFSYEHGPDVRLSTCSLMDKTVASDAIVAGSSPVGCTT